jgi:Ca-activated chloride channel homolog
MTGRPKRLAILALCLVLSGCHCRDFVAPAFQPEQTCHMASAEITDKPLRVLAGSELQDLADPVLAQVKEKTGVEVRLTLVGTLTGVEQVTQGTADGKYDAIWFSSNGYLRLDDERGRPKIAVESEIMRSPVILGLRSDKAQQLFGDDRSPTWQKIVNKAGNGLPNPQFTFGMSEPASSNSGFSTVLALTAALANTGVAATEDDIANATRDLVRVFGAQELFEGSSGWLTDVFVASGYKRVDGLFNYESELLRYRSLRDKNQDLPALRLIYPSDGVVMADYPLTLLTSADADAERRYRAVVNCLLDPQIQEMIARTTNRRPVNRQVGFPEPLKSSDLTLVPRPSQLSVANRLIRTFKDEIRRPANAVYVLDVSGSMADPAATQTISYDGRPIATKIEQLRAALTGLTGADTSLSGQLTSFNARETVTLLPFSDSVQAPRTFTVAPDSPRPALDQIAASAQSLTAHGDTALYDALKRAYELAGEQILKDTNRFTTIVLLTDGERTQGDTLCNFYDFYNKIGDDRVRRVRVHVVFLRSAPAATPGPPVAQPGCPNTGTYQDQMTQLAERTGGRFFDSKDWGSLPELFKEIRAYQ